MFNNSSPGKRGKSQFVAFARFCGVEAPGVACFRRPNRGRKRQGPSGHLSPKPPRTRNLPWQAINHLPVQIKSGSLCLREMPLVGVFSEVIEGVAFLYGHRTQLYLSREYLWPRHYVNQMCLSILTYSSSFSCWC